MGSDPAKLTNSIAVQAPADAGRGRRLERREPACFVQPTSHQGVAAAIGYTCTVNLGYQLPVAQGIQFEL
jgi:hypothetical protein